jgi:hypothetical protein
MARQIAGEARLQGLSYGTYILTFLVGGDYDKTPYTFTTSYERASDSLINLRFISMGDSRRHQHLAAMIQELDQIEGVNAIGFDYVRNDTGSLEFVDEFLADMGYRLPASLRDGSLAERQLWLGRLLSLDTLIPLEAQWDWWRAQKVARVMKGIIDQAKPSKPLFIFSLGWKRGHQHGQDPRMFIDAGINFKAPMFYEVDTAQMAVLLEDWKSYLSGQGGSFVFGEPVDSMLLKNSRGMNGPEEHYLRQVETLAALNPLASHVGLFWHDINRAIAGGRGPQSMREWAIAGAASFSRLRENAGVVPIRADILEDAAESPLGITFTVRITNLTGERIPLLRVDGVRVPGISLYQPTALDVPSLKPFESREMSWMALKVERVIKERYRAQTPDMRMLALRARVPGSEKYRRPSFAFKYVGSRQLPEIQGSPELEPQP